MCLNLLDGYSQILWDEALTVVSDELITRTFGVKIFKYKQSSTPLGSTPPAPPCIHGSASCVASNVSSQGLVSGIGSYTGKCKQLLLCTPNPKLKYSNHLLEIWDHQQGVQHMVCPKMHKKFYNFCSTLYDHEWSPAKICDEW